MTVCRVTLFVVLLFAIADSPHAQHLSEETVASNDHAVSSALSGMGLDVDMDVYGVMVQRAFNELYPDERYDQRRLSPMQARAVAYVSLLLNVNPGIEMYPEPHPVLQEGSFLHTVRMSIDDMRTGIPAQGPDLLNEDERVFLHRSASELGQIAASHDCAPLETAATELINLASAGQAERRDAAARIDELRRLAVEC